MATLNISITVPDAQQTRVIDSFCQKHGYDVALGLTKIQFIKRIIARFIKNSILENEVGPYADAAAVEKAAEISAIIID